MEVFLMCMVAGHLLRVWANDLMAGAKGQPLPSQERWRARQAAQAARGERADRNSGLMGYLRASGANAVDRWAQKSAYKAERRRAWIESQEPERSKKWMDKQRQRQDRREALREGFAKARGATWSAIRETAKVGAAGAGDVFRAAGRLPGVNRHIDRVLKAGIDNADTATPDSEASNPKAQPGSTTKDGTSKAAAGTQPAAQAQQPAEKEQDGITHPCPLSKDGKHIPPPQSGPNCLYCGEPYSNSVKVEVVDPNTTTGAATAPTSAPVAGKAPDTSDANTETPSGSSDETANSNEAGGISMAEMSAEQIAQEVSRASDVVTAMKQKLAGLLDQLRAQGWTGAPMAQMELCFAQMRQAADHATTAASSIRVGTHNVRDAYQANPHVGRKESVMAGR